MAQPDTLPKMVDLDHSRPIDIESIRNEYAAKFKTYVPKAGTPLQQTAPTHDKKYKLYINPPLLNSSCPWASDLEQLQALYDSPYTGAVTTRTSLLEGFNHDPSVHQHVFFPTGHHASSSSVSQDHASAKSDGSAAATASSTSVSSLNTYGYSPHTLSEYLGHINAVIGQRHLGTSTEYKKPFIISVTGTPDEIAMSYALLANAAEMDEGLRLNLEINLSCPNIKGKPPPAYDMAVLKEYLEAIRDSKATYRGRLSGEESVPRVGIKLPPYTWMGQFTALVDALRSDEARSSEPGEGSVIDFLTATNTLGSSLVFDESLAPALQSEAGTGIGGMAGAALHPLALGNVATLRKLLDEHTETENVMVIGVGGVEDKAGFERMRKAGAEAVACASALGRRGVRIFEDIAK